MTTVKNLIDFPSNFSFKVIGKNTPAFKLTVFNIVQRYFRQLTERALQQRTSSNEHYLALTITVTAETQQQLDAVYHDLSAEPLVLMAL